MQTFELVIKIAGPLSVLIAALGLLYTGRQLRFVAKVHFDNHEWNRRIAAQEAISKNYQIAPGAESIFKEFDIFNSLDAIPLERYMEVFSRKPELQVTLHRFLNHHETLCRGIVHGIYDEELIKSARAGTLDKVIRNHMNYIIYRRGTVPKAYPHIEFIANKWKNQDGGIRVRNAVETERP